MVHDLSPFLWQISGDFGVRWYGLSYMVGFILAYLIMGWIASRQKMGMTKEMVGDFITYCAIGTLVGGRLGYVIFYSPDLILNFRAGFPFWGVLAVNEGGMASHGGMIGLVVAAVLYSWKTGINQLYLFDLMVVSGPLGVAFGRIANFINGELVGRTVDPSFPLAVKFPNDILQWPNESLAAADKLQGLASVVEKIPGLSKDQYLEKLQQISSSANAKNYVIDVMYKVIEAIQNGNLAAKEAIGPLLEARHPSQLYAAFGEGFMVFLVLFLFWRKPKKPGLVGALFVVLYAVTRIITEQFRLPDAHIGFQMFGLTRGQWLSVVMLVIGLLLMFYWSRRDSLPVAGWGRGHNIKLHRK